ncbi:MAG: hypothetical protein HY914_05235 [Desulfomonile tiedjei]|nr:hypothetical protein [Desulfomonile tiedjei]
MNVYILDADVNKYRGIHYTNEDDVVEFMRGFNGTPMKDRWTAQETFQFDHGRLVKGDTPGLATHVPVFSLKATKVLADFLDLGGELLPITCAAERYFVFNVTRVIDALDEGNCELELFDDGDIMDILRFAFFLERLEGTSVFKVPQCILTDVFVTDPFVERVQTAKLKGFKFRLVWSSD